MICPTRKLNLPKKARKLLINTTISIRSWRANRSVNAVRLSLLAGMVALVSVLVACEEPKDIGLPPTTAIGVLYTDTLSVKTSTVLLDSVVTDRNSRLFVGQYNDPVFGKVSAKTFGQLYVSGGSFKTEGEIVYDSVRVLVGYSYVYGDTSKTQDIYVHRLTEDMDSTKRYTNTSSVAYAATPLTKITLKPTAAGGAGYGRLPDALGRELLELSKGSGVVQADFQKVFKGIAVVPDAANTTVFGFSNNMFVELYYHKATDSTALGIDFFTTAGKPSFSQIKIDRSATKLAALSLTNSLPASATGGEVFVQSATGVTTRLNFPTLLNLKKESGRIAINRAELNLFVKGSSPGGPIPPLMTLAQTDDNNRILYSPETGTATRLLHLVQVQGGTFQTTNKWYYPQVVAYSSRPKTYTFDVTTYLQSILIGVQANNSLVLLPTTNTSLTTTSQTTGATNFLAQPYINNQLNGAILNGPMNAKLVVFYTYTP
ncbi:DUF4270 family protein [Larkinella rosea]|uniref:DUF4270 family protein n=1 Tax=Larkinella rosea TaxID=2025312 RepID=A0A3P1BTF9_9BACT|nr:DUF4270 family protein [Larkinella rosea]